MDEEPGIAVWPPDEDGDLMLALIGASVIELEGGDLATAVFMKPKAAAKIAGILLEFAERAS